MASSVGRKRAGVTSAATPSGPSAHPIRRGNVKNTPEEDRVVCCAILAAVVMVLARFVYLFHDRIRIMAGGEDHGGAGCYQMMWHSCTFETEVCCPEGCAAAGGLWVDGGVCVHSLRALGCA